MSGIVNIQSHLQRQIMPGTFLRIRIMVGNFSWMSISVEPLIENLKVDPLQIVGSQKAAWIVLLSVLLYLPNHCLLYCKTRKGRPKAIKHMLGS